MQVVSYEPQKVALTDGRRGASDVAWFPIIAGDVRGSVGRYEFGGMWHVTRIGAETRCGLLQERLDHPLSIALSGAMAVDYGPYTGVFGRIGLDISRRFGPLALVDVYLSTGDAMRFIEDPGDPPPEGPTGGSKSIVRRETRLTVPLGIAIRTAQLEGGSKAPWVWIVVGATPWLLIKDGPCQDKPCRAAKWDADRGMGFTMGVEIR